MFEVREANLHESTHRSAGAGALLGSSCMSLQHCTGERAKHPSLSRIPRPYEAFDHPGAGPFSSWRTSFATSVLKPQGPPD